MSRVYDNWEKLVGAVLKREELRQIARSESLSSSISADFSSRFSEKFDPTDPSNQGIFFSRNVMAVEYNEIKKATNNFRPDMLLGEGGFGRGFKGWIHEHYLTAVEPGCGIVIAVKKWKKESMVRHEWARGEHRSLSWATRIKVATGAARALSFLHNLAIPVTHRGFNTVDILLDGESNAKLSDFGLARDGPTDDVTHVSTEVVGTKGYAAPEYIATGQLTTKCHVYGFGVILLELLSELRSYGMNRVGTNRVGTEKKIVDWARPYLGNKRTLSRIMDTRLEGQYPRKRAYIVGKLAYQCLNHDPKLRPRMAEVVVTLEHL